MPKINKEIYVQGLKDKYTILQLMEYIKSYFPTIIDTNNAFVNNMIVGANCELISETDESCLYEVSLLNDNSEVVATFEFSALRGVKGDKGDRGEKGETGEKGEQGEPGITNFYRHNIIIHTPEGWLFSSIRFSFINSDDTPYNTMDLILNNIGQVVEHMYDRFLQWFTYSSSGIIPYSLIFDESNVQKQIEVHFYKPSDSKFYSATLNSSSDVRILDNVESI